MIDTGQIAIDRANERVAREEEAAEKWRSEHTCGECEWCHDGKVEVHVAGRAAMVDVGWCSRNDWLLGPDDLETTVDGMGCFE